MGFLRYVLIVAGKATVAIAVPARLGLLPGAIRPGGSAANSSRFGDGVIVSA